MLEVETVEGWAQGLEKLGERIGADRLQQRLPKPEGDLVAVGDALLIGRIGPHVVGRVRLEPRQGRGEGPRAGAGGKEAAGERGTRLTAPTEAARRNRSAAAVGDLRLAARRGGVELTIRGLRKKVLQLGI